jgi:hypothetical protein
MGEVKFELLPADRSRISTTRWYLSAWIMRLAYWVMPRGDARDALGQHIGKWLWNYASWFRADLLAEMASATPRQPGHPWSEHLWRIGQHVHELRGKNLACWCKPGEPCHADVLLELANSEPE